MLNFRNINVKLYHKRLLWLIDFSQEEAPTWPISRGRLGMIHPEESNTVKETLMHVGVSDRVRQAHVHTDSYLNKTLAYPDQYDAAVMAASSRGNQHVEGGCGHYGEAKHS